MALQKTLRGFSSFLGLFRGGSFPLNELNTLQPVIEMEDWLGPNVFQLTRQSITGLGQAALFTVPDGEFWRVKWAARHYIALGAGHSVRTRLVYVPIEGSGTIPKVFLDDPLGGLGTADGPANTPNGGGIRLKDFNARAGDQIGYEVTVITGAPTPFNLDGFIQYQKILV